MTASHIKTSFSAGEISPLLWGHTNLAKLADGCTTMRNTFSDYRGPARSRPGLAYCSISKQALVDITTPPRIIPFQFSLKQGYVLEFGHLYMRVIYRGAYITEANCNITALTQDTPGQFTYDNTNYALANGDWVFMQGIGGMTQFNNLIWVVANATSTTFTVTDLFGNPVNTVLSPPYTSGGTLARVFTVTSPYSATDLPWLKFVQNKDTMSICCVNQDTQTEYPAYDLIRKGDTDWTFNQAFFGSAISAPTNVTVTAKNSTTKDTWYSYVVTAVDANNNESVASTAGSAENNNISVNKGSNKINFSSVAGAQYYKLYEAVPSYTDPVQLGVNYGFIGTSFSTTFTDSNIVADFTQTPPTHEDPFAPGPIITVNVTAGGSGYAQNTISYSITTSTGSGFQGVPVVDPTSGALTAFIVQNGGTGYAPTDTITILSGSNQASGTYTFSGNPSNNQTIILNGQTWKFKISGQTPNTTIIGGSLAVTLQNLVANLNASQNHKIQVATYSVSGSVMTITYNTSGTQGNSYSLAAGSYGGTVSGAHLTGGTNGSGGGGATTVLNVGAASGTYPSVPSYYQQRRVYASTLTQPDTYWMSKPGQYLNFDESTPPIDSDSITGTPWSLQVNGIQFLSPAKSGLAAFTGSGVWLVNGGSATAITPSDQNADAQAQIGCSATVPPIQVNYDFLYIQSKGGIPRDISYNFFVNIYTGQDLSVYASHLFSFKQIYQWAWAEEPYKIVWATRSDGEMLSLTYLKEQEVMGWARHDTQGLFMSVCSVTEPPVDAVYVVVKRYISGNWTFMIERMDNRNWRDVEDCFCVDAGLRYPLTFPAATLTASAASGESSITAVKIIDGGHGYTSPIITAVDESGAGTGASFTAIVTGGVITSITPVNQGNLYVPGLTTIDITDPTGTGAKAAAIIQNIISFSTDQPVFASTDVGSVIRLGSNSAIAQASGVTLSGGGRAIITQYVSSTQVMADLVQDITAVIPDDDNTPIPAPSGQWSMTKPTKVVSGLNHLEGMTVVALADGGVVRKDMSGNDLVVTGGQITLPVAASSIVVGLPFTAQTQTTHLEIPGAPTIQGKRKSIPQAILRLENTRGLQYGVNQPNQSTTADGAIPVWTRMAAVKQRTALIHAGLPVPLETDDFLVNLGSQWDRRGFIAVQAVDPLPYNLTAVVPYFEVGDTQEQK